MAELCVIHDIEQHVIVLYRSVGAFSNLWVCMHFRGPRDMFVGDMEVMGTRHFGTDGLIRGISRVGGTLMTILVVAADIIATKILALLV